MIRAILVAVGLAAVGAAAAAADQAPPAIPKSFFSLMTGDSLSGWTVEHRSPDSVSAADGVMTVTEQAGWVRVERIVGDVTLRLDARTTSPAGRAVLVIRGHGSTPQAFGYAVPLTAVTTTMVSAPKLTMMPVNAAGLAHALHEDWNRYEIRCTGDRVIAMVNGELIASVSSVATGEGWVGVRVEDGSLQLRNVSMGPADAAVQASPDSSAHATYLPGDTVTLPKLRHEVHPNYTADAMRAKISGTVLLECVVQADGTVGAIRVLRSLDSAYGLDDEAINAARRWRFSPALKEGKPVAVVVTIEMTFSLRK